MDVHHLGRRIYRKDDCGREAGAVMASCLGLSQKPSMALGVEPRGWTCSSRMPRHLGRSSTQSRAAFPGALRQVRHGTTEMVAHASFTPLLKGQKKQLCCLRLLSLQSVYPLLVGIMIGGTIAEPSKRPSGRREDVMTSWILQATSGRHCLGKVPLCLDQHSVEQRDAIVKKQGGMRGSSRASGSIVVVVDESCEPIPSPPDIFLCPPFDTTTSSHGNKQATQSYR